MFAVMTSDELVLDEKFRVNFYFRKDTYSPRGGTNTWTYLLVPLGGITVASSDSLIQTVSQLIAQNRDLEGVLVDHDTLQANLLRDGVNASSYDSPEDEARLRYGRDGADPDAILFSHPLWDYHFHLSFADIKWFTDTGHVQGQFGEFVISAPGGAGGDSTFTDLAGWLLDHGVDIGIEITRDVILFKVLAPILRRFRRSRADKHMRKIAALWEYRELRYPAQLREFFDTKQHWTVREVAKRLSLSDTSSKQLLVALGYDERAAKQWSYGLSKGRKEGAKSG
jgi:hypothetical protein